ncbi:MAG TPA: PKD domain-containing protein [Bacteroidia bacterium]|nr:PKD domain-containing protein [Bacteroidia bacterium]
MGKQLLKFIFGITVMFGALTADIQNAQASHSMGADLTYQCLGGNTYKIRVSFYRDCIGIAAPPSAFVNIVSASCGQSLGVTCNPVSGTGQEVTPLCSTAVSTCNGGIFTGIQEWVYEGIVTLPMQCTDWTFSYNLCCRNAAITNISAPAASTFYIYATLNNTVSPCNSSPTFSNKPVPFACLGQQFCFNHGAYDVDGDSLAYSLINPLQTATTTVTYNPGFSATNPLTSSPAVAFNNSTGDICITPTNLEVTVMAVLVKEYRNGVLIGSVERDIQLTVLNCNNSLPSLSGINGTNNFSATVCAGSQLCFNINSFDPDPGQNVYINWDNSIPGATFTSSGGPLPVGTFCWTPSQSQISNTPYCFTVRVNDDACPMNGAQVYSYCITVIGINVNAGPDQLIACNDQATVSVAASGGTGNYTYQWSNGATLPIQTVGAGTYIVTVSDGVCSNTDTVSVINAFVPTAAFTAAGSCANGPVQFTNTSIVPGGIITAYNWNFGDGGTSIVQNPIHQFPGPGTYNVTFVVSTNLGCIDTVVQPVVILPPPTANFTAPSGCSGASVTYTNTTTPAGGVYTWQWNLGNGQTSNAQNPSVTYSSPGTYTVTLVAIDSSGCSDTLSQQVVINPQPTASFTYSGSQCQGSTITFNNTSTPGTGTITGVSWNFGNGQTGTGNNPSVTYPGAGNYDVTLIVTNSAGCSDTIVQNIGINPPPAISTGPAPTICLGATAVLTANGGVTYSWSPGGQTGDIISVSPVTTTTYTVTATDANGCTNTATVTVTVNPLPVINVSPDQSICLGQTATLTASGAVTYSWSPSGNTTSTINVSPSASTTYAVTGTNANGCSATNFVSVNVNPLPVVSLSNVFICPGVSSIMDAGNTGSTFQWSTGATTQFITVSSAGLYTVTVTNNFGCSATGTGQVSQGGTIVNTLQNTSFCSGGSTVLNAGNPGSTYQWSTGATTQTITVNAGGAYSVTVTDANGCTGIISTTVNVNPVPVANFIPSDICINQPLQFTDISSIASGSIVAWNWDFGDGNVSQQQNPVHSYNGPGTYSVTLTVTSNLGCTNTIVRNFTVFPLPQANFSYSFDCQNQPVQFNDQSFTNVGNITSWFWDFGDGTTSTLQNPVHTFTTPGMHVVTLTVSTGGGCEDTRPRNIQVYPVPSLSFTFSSNGVCSGSTVTVTNTSNSSNGAINSWSWDFGDGTTSSQANPVHTFTSPGTYNISLIAVTSHGCSDTLTQPFTVFPLPNADAGPNQWICRGDTAQITATGGVSYVWNTGATTATIHVSPQFHTTYTVTVTDANGCVAVDSARIYIRWVPDANAGPDKSICIGSSVTLTGSGSNSLSWNPGGSTSASITVSPTVTTTYILTANAPFGCYDTDTVTVVVNSLPQANAGPDQMICEGSTATLAATGGVSYLWYPSGLTTSTIYVNPAVPTVYTVQVTDANGCVNHDTVSVGINAVPVANISPAFICLGSSTILDAGNPGSTYLWSPNGETSQSITVSDSGYFSVVIQAPNGCQGFAGTQVTIGGTGIVVSPTNVQVCSGSTAVLSAGNPGSTYLWSTGATSQNISVGTAGIYTVTITDVTGCSASVSSNLMVNPLPNVSFIADPVCNGNTTVFQNTSTISTGNIASWNWNFGDGGVNATFGPQHLYAQSGTYNVTLQAVSGMGCTAWVTNSVSVSDVPQAAFTANVACIGTPTQFTNNTVITNGTVTSWSWDFGDGSASASQAPAHTYSAPGLYTVTYIAQSAAGCSDTVSAQVLVLEGPQIDFTAQDVCQGLPVLFANSSSIGGGAITQYAWAFGDGNSSSATNPSHIYGAAGIYQVTLTATSDQGCQATDTISVEIYNNPNAVASATGVCDGLPVQFTNNSTINSGSITGVYWAFGDGSSSNAQNPAHQYGTAGAYTAQLVLTSDHGCRDTALVPVSVHELPAVAFTGTNACLGTAVQFTDQSAVTGSTVTGWTWNFGDGSTSTAQNPTHNYAAYGSYHVTLMATSAFGCLDSGSSTVNVYPVPVAAFAGNDACVGETIQFYDQSQIAGGGTFTATWDFGDGSSGTGSVPQHAYAASGTYSVTLTVTSSNGCTSAITKQFTIHAPPVANFSAQNACAGTQVIFNDLSSSANGAISSWSWTLGDGTSSVAAAPVHTYNTFGTYNVSLTVISIYGCSGSTSSDITIYPVPVPVISAVNNCVYDPVSFNSITAVGDTTLYNYMWTFGDGTTSAQDDPVHQYPGAGSYTVTLTMTTGNGCTATATSSVDIWPAPDASFNVANGCQGSSIQFNNTSTISSGTISGYTWNFGDSTATSTLVNPVHTYGAAGTYTVTLIATSNNGCTDTTTQQITVFPQPVPGFTYSQAAGCGPLTVYFTDSSFVSSGYIVSWLWDFGNGSTSTLQNPSTVYTASGNYGVTLTVFTNNGCTETYSQPNIITVYPGPTATFTPDPYQASINYPVITFGNNSSGANTWNWTFGDGTGSVNWEPVHTYPDTGWYQVLLTVVNTFGCIDTMTQMVYIMPEFTLYIPNAFTPNHDGVNDYFNISGIGIVTATTNIYNRWGENIYTFDLKSGGWDGSVQKDNSVAQEDVYVYDSIVMDVFGKTHRHNGTVTLVR